MNANNAINKQPFSTAPIIGNEIEIGNSGSAIAPLLNPIQGYEAAKLMVRQLGYKIGDHFWLKVNNLFPHKVEIRESIELLPSGEPDIELFLTRYEKHKQLDENGRWIKDEKGKYLNIKDKDGDDIWFPCKNTHGWEELIPGLSNNKDICENGIFIIPNKLGDGIRAKHWECSNTIFIEIDNCT
ncbi:MAG: hypothetical protein ICV78_10455, partial [Tolypothrix sp. Co-bin9]|nr:hypothetical protein [Tolypothrix sp. Co-bin9]